MENQEESSIVATDHTKVALDRARALADECVNRLDFLIGAYNSDQSDIHLLRAYRALQDARHNADDASLTAMGQISREREMPDELIVYELTGEFAMRKERKG